MLRHPGDPAQIDLCSKRNDEVFKLQTDSGGERTGIDQHLLFLQIDALDTAPDYFQAAAKSPDRIDHMAGRERCAGDFSKHGLKHHVILLTDDPGVVVHLAEFATASQFPAAVDSGKASAQNSDLQWNSIWFNERGAWHNMIR